MTTNTDSPIGVLLMAYGGPNSLAEIPGYLADIRSGRPTGRAVCEEISHNYAQIGGRSPLMEKTLEQVADDHRRALRRHVLKPRRAQPVHHAGEHPRDKSQDKLGHDRLDVDPDHEVEHTDHEDHLRNREMVCEPMSSG